MNFLPLLSKYAKKRRFAFVITLFVILFLSVVFALSLFNLNKNQVLSISTEILVYSGLLIVFYAFVMEMHYKELHNIATDPVLLKHNKKLGIEHYKNNLEHNVVMVFLSFFGITILLASGVLDMINYRLRLIPFLWISALFIFVASAGIVTILWFIITGKINDAEKAVDDSKIKIN